MSYRNFSTIDSCCHECEERHPACHDHCEKYIEAKKKWDEKNIAIRESKKDERLYKDYKYNRIEKAKGVIYGKYQ